MKSLYGNNPCIGKVQRQIHRFMRSSYQKPAHLSINPTVLFGKLKNARERFAPHTGTQQSRLLAAVPSGTSIRSAA